VSAFLRQRLRTHAGRHHDPYDRFSANFHLSNDGHGGTLVSDPPVPAHSEPAPAAIASPHRT
jgi:hypothetical protein